MPDTTRLSDQAAELGRGGLGRPESLDAAIGRAPRAGGWSGWRRSIATCSGSPSGNSATGPRTPVAVIVSEAVRLAKTYSTEHSGGSSTGCWPALPPRSVPERERGAPDPRGARRAPRRRRGASRLAWPRTWPVSRSASASSTVPGRGWWGRWPASGRCWSMPSCTRSPSAGRAARRLGEYGARWVTAHATGGATCWRRWRTGLASRSAGGVRDPRDHGAHQSRCGGPRPRRTRRQPRQARGPIGQGRGRRRGRRGGVRARNSAMVVEVAPGLVRVTPGIRPAGRSRRRSTGHRRPRRRRCGGAPTSLVVGRPIVTSADPVEAAAALADRWRPDDSRRGGGSWDHRS